jgi:hypothetical protein
MAFGVSNWPVPPPLAEIFGALCSLEEIMTSCVERGANRGLGTETLAGKDGINFWLL